MNSSPFNGFISTKLGAKENRSETMKHWKNWNEDVNDKIEIHNLLISLFWKHVVNHFDTSGVKKSNEDTCF